MLSLSGRALIDERPEEREFGQLAGSWRGSGLLIVQGAPGVRDAVSYATRETLTLAPITLAEGDLSPGGWESRLPGVYFLARSSDAHSGRTLHAESGAWMAITGNEPALEEVVCVCTRAAGPPVLAAGSLDRGEGPPSIPACSGSASAGGASAAGIGLDELADPHLWLRRRLEGQPVAETTRFTVTTEHDASLARLLERTGIAVQTQPEVRLARDMWLEHLDDPAGSVPTQARQLQLQTSRRCLKTLDGGERLEVAVATLRPAATSSRRRGRGQRRRGAP